jgi:hypothetical protein
MLPTGNLPASIPPPIPQEEDIEWIVFRNLKPNAIYSYIPLIHRLRLLYADASSSEELQKYILGLQNTARPNEKRDIWEGETIALLQTEGSPHYKFDSNFLGYFSDCRDIGLQLSLDGVQLFKSGTVQVWPFLILNLNKPLESRFRVKNFLSLGLSPGKFLSSKSANHFKGPHEPAELDTFLEPLVAELTLLHDGVIAYDAYRQETFTLRAHLVLVTGDSPAIAKVLHLTGHNGYSPCRFCTIKGTPYQKKYKVRDTERTKITYHYPLNPPADLPPDHAVSADHHSYDPLDLPKRTNAGFKNDAKSAESDSTGAMAKQTGIKSSSILFRVPSIRFPYSFPIDIMHLIYLGLTRDLVQLLNGSYFSATGKARDTSPPYALSEKVWKEIGNEMAKARIPTGYGRQTRNIDKYLKSMKSEECATFLHNMSQHLLKGRVSPEVHTMLLRLILGSGDITCYQLYCRKC